MKSIITEEMRYRQKVVEYAEKYDNNAKAARRYGTSRQNVQRWRKRYYQITALDEFSRMRVCTLEG
uniref:helix-turn-helix domain-containing protein n=1 Tax=Dolosicoccus paucivorans TaxID=84521 RepID=UPI001FD06FED|nr:helix-turn-helix domain-containing protein [Dolosicoccus paucivorans]